MEQQVPGPGTFTSDETRDESRPQDEHGVATDIRYTRLAQDTRASGARQTPVGLRARVYGTQVIRLLQYRRRCRICTSDILHFDFLTPVLSETRSLSTRFYAISYTWGLDPTYSPMVLNGARVLIPNSAEVALRGVVNHLNSKWTRVLLPIWIDAVCINQGDLTEKQNQIQMMGKIYSRAKAVYIWLGPADGARELGMKAMEVLARQNIPKHILDGDTRDESSSKLPLPPTVSISELKSFLSCKWFTRLWTVQEVVRGHREIFVCGNQHIEWQTFYQGMLWLYTMWQKTHTELWVSVRSTFIMSLLKKVYRPTVIKKGFGLDCLLLLTIHYETTNPWDRIYGLLGMVSDHTTATSNAPTIVPNYATPLADVYREAISHALRYPGPVYLGFGEEDDFASKIMILGQLVCPVPEDEIEEWPSWVPRYHEARSRLHILPPAPVGGGASADCQMLYNLDPANDNLLIIRGVRVSMIRAVHTKDMTEFLEQLWDTDRKLQPIHFESLANVLNVAHVADVAPADLGKFLLSCQRSPQEKCTTLQKIIDHFGGKDGHSEYARSVINDPNNSQYTLIELENGSFARVLSDVKSGDHICILFGYDFPIVLRRSGDCYKLRGFAVVPNIMNGEHITMLKDEGRLEAETVDFTLS